MEQIIDNMFEIDTQNSLLQEWEKLAEFIVVESDSIAREEQKIKDRKTNLDAIKQQLAEQMFANGAANGHKFDNGINIKPRTKTKVFKASGVDDETMFNWLKQHDLGDIIKPYVHWNTLNATINAELDAGHEVPKEIFNITHETTVSPVGNGHKKFLDKRQA